MEEKAKAQVPADLRILHYGAAALRRPAARIKRLTANLRALAEQMEALMKKADGLGLAAPQVGVERQLAVVDLGEGPIVLVNPRLLKKEGEEVMVEGCLSLPGLFGEVKRAAKVLVSATDLSGKAVRIEAEGLPARVLQHEIDHLQGRLFIDRVEESTLHWLIHAPAREATAPKEAKPEPLAQPTTLQDALRVFLSRPSS